MIRNKVVIMKKTKSREQVKQILINAREPLNAQDIFNRDFTGLTLSTIYRTLIAFEQEGLIKKEVSPITREATYSWKDDEEHGHILECVKCRKQIRLDYCPFEGVNELIEEKTGFTLDDENHVLYGVCKECNQKLKNNVEN